MHLEASQAIGGETVSADTDPLRPVTVACLAAIQMLDGHERYQPREAS